MHIRAALLTALTITTLCGTTDAAAHTAPRSVRATYTGNVNGMMVGTISESLDSTGGAYTIVSETRPQGIALLIQRQPLRFVSRGQITPDGLRPTHFEARRSAADPPKADAQFDWTRGVVLLRHDGKDESLPLVRGTQDRLSIMYQFMFAPPAADRLLEFAMTNGRKLSTYRYRVIPDVEIDTALGRLRTVHLVKERAPGDTVTEVWLSPAHRYFPVKILIVEKSGMHFEQSIQRLELRD